MIYFSELLKNKLPDFSESLKDILIDNRIDFKFLKNTKDIWCRDYMPIEVSKNEFILFNYNPSYLKGAGYLKTNNKNICDKEGIIYKYSSIILDGGNVVKLNNKVILTDRVFLENKTRNGDAKLLSKLEGLLQSEVIIIPTEENDIIGHSDGMVRFIDDTTVLVNDYNQQNSSTAFRNKLYKVLEANNLRTILFPYAPDENWTPKNKYDVAPATGVYINYLQSDDTVILPIFSIEEDIKATITLTKYFKKVIPFNCQSLASHGGVLNCISWN